MALILQRDLRRQPLATGGWTRDVWLLEDAAAESDGVTKPAAGETSRPRRAHGDISELRFQRQFPSLCFPSFDPPISALCISMTVPSNSLIPDKPNSLKVSINLG